MGDVGMGWDGWERRKDTAVRLLVVVAHWKQSKGEQDERRHRSSAVWRSFVEIKLLQRWLRRLRLREVWGCETRAIALISSGRSGWKRIFGMFWLRETRKARHRAQGREQKS